MVFAVVGSGWMVVVSKLFWKLKNEVVLLESSFISSSSFLELSSDSSALRFLFQILSSFFFSRDEHFFFLENYRRYESTIFFLDPTKKRESRKEGGSKR